MGAQIASAEWQVLTQTGILHVAPSGQEFLIICCSAQIQSPDIEPSYTAWRLLVSKMQNLISHEALVVVLRTVNKWINKEILLHVNVEALATSGEVTSGDDLPGPGRLVRGLKCCHVFLSCCTRRRYSGTCSKENNSKWGVFAVCAMQRLPLCFRLILSNMLWLRTVVRADNCWVFCMVHNKAVVGREKAGLYQLAWMRITKNRG